MSAKTGYVVGWYGRYLKTTDGGVSWNIDSIYNHFLNRVRFLDVNTGFIGSDGKILRTTNSGSNWDLIDVGIGPADHVFSIFFPSNNTGYTAGNFSLNKTTDSGNNWFLETAGYFYFYDIYFINDFTGYAVGGTGRIIKTTTGGGVLNGMDPNGKTKPSSPSLSQNYPNPFNPVTRIKFSLPTPSKGGVWYNVRLVIYDILGREVATLIPPLGGGQEGLKPGSYEVRWDGSRYASGVYFYKLVTDEYAVTRKMVLIK